MDVSFSPGPRAALSSAPLSPSHFHLPASFRREFLGCGAHPIPPGLRSRRTCGRSNLRIRSPRCAFHDYPYESSVLAAATVVATFAALQVFYKNYSRWRRESPKISDEEVPNVMVTGELCNDVKIMEQGTILRQLGSESSYADPLFYKESNTVDETLGSICSEKAHASDTKDAHGMQLQTSALVREDNKRWDCNDFSAIETINALDKTAGLEALTISPIMLHKVDLMVTEREEAVAASNMTGVIVEPNLSCFAFPVEKQIEINQDNELEHIRDEDGEIPRLISCLEHPNTVTLHRSYQDNVVPYSQLRPTLKVADLPAQDSHLSEGTGTKGRVPIGVHDFTKMEKSLTLKLDNKSSSGFCQPNGRNVMDANDRAGYLKTYNRFLRDARLKECVDLLENMDGKGLLDMDKVHHSRFLKACKGQKAVEEAYRFCKLIKKPTLSTFNMLLSICATSQDFDGAFKVMLLVKEAGLKPDCKLYTTLISACAKCGKVDAMFEVFHEMVNAGIEPNANTYGALIDGCARAGQVAKAFGAYGIMRSKKVQPDRVIFNALITACGQSGAVVRAFDVLAEMMAEPKPIDPDHVTIGALMKTCTQAGQVDRVREVYKMLDQYKIKGTPDVYTIAVRSCSQTSDLTFALSIYDDMKRNGVVPDEMFLSTLIDVAGHAGKVEAAFDIIEDARSKGIHLGSVSYSSLMGACCNAKSWQKALELYEDIKAIKLIPTVSMLNALITSLCDGDQLLKSIEVLDEMKKAGVCPNIITYSIIIVACEKKGEAESGLMLLSQAKEDGILPNLIMCRCLTGLCLQSFQKANSLGEPIVSFNSGRPQVENKWTSSAIMVYRQTIAASVVPTIEVFSQVLGCLQFPRDTSLRNRFVENLGINFDASSCTNIRPYLDGFGEYDTHCFSIFEEAVSLGVVPRVSIKDNPIVVDARKLHVHTVEVYLLTVLKGLKHRLAAGAKLPNITILLSIEKGVIQSAKGEKSINLVGRVGRAAGSLLRRLGIFYQGGESLGKIRITGLTLRRWFKPNLTGSSSEDGRPLDMIPTPSRLAKGISDQQRRIRNNSYLSIE